MACRRWSALARPRWYFPARCWRRRARRDRDHRADLPGPRQGARVTPREPSIDRSILSRSSSRCRWSRYHCKGRHRGMSGRLVACRNGRPLLLWADRRFANVRKSSLISIRADRAVCKSKGLTLNRKTTSAGVANSCGDRAVRVQRRLRIRDVEARKRLGAPTSTLLPRSLCYAKVAYTRERSRG